MDSLSVLIAEYGQYVNFKVGLCRKGYLATYIYKLLNIL